MSIYTNKFYIYVYLREDGTPYYIGKGKGKRAWSNNRSIPKPTDPSRIKIHTDNLTEEQAFSLERDLISEYGRKDNGTGILRNLTDGGEGASGYKHSEEAKRKISAASSGENHPLYGKSLPEETKRKLSAANIGKNLSEETRARISKSHSGKTIPESVRRKLSKSHSGKTIPESVRRKISAAFSGKNNHQYGKGKPCIVNGVRYETVREAAEALNVNYNTALNRAKNKSKGWSYVDQSGKGKPCIVNGVRYETVREAAESLGINYTTALHRAKNKSKGWSYV